MELYYYTSTETMQFILQKGDIFATNIRYMNDSEEYFNGLKEIKKLACNREMIEQWLRARGRKTPSLNSVEKAFTDENLQKNMEDMGFYSISFCEKNDLLSQWAIYAKEAGVSIKMKFEEETYRFITEGMAGKAEKEEVEKKEKAEWDLLPRRVYYFTYDSMKDQEQEYTERAYTILDRLYEADMKDYIEDINEVWKYVSTFVKRYDFYQEAERRLVFQPKKCVYQPKIEYRNDKNVLKPYLDIECKGGWPIWEIMVGPGFNQQVVYNSVVHFLEHVQIKNGIKSTEEYVQRVLHYFKPYEAEMEKSELYMEMMGKLSDSLPKKKCLKELQEMVGENMKMICKSICADKGYCNELQNYRLSES